MAYVQKYMRCLPKNRLDTKLLRIHLFSVFTVKTTRALAALAPLGLLIAKTLTNVLLLLQRRFHLFARWWYIVFLIAFGHINLCELIHVEVKLHVV